MPKKRTFAQVLAAVGPRPRSGSGQNATRHYSEVFSREVALWLREEILAARIGVTVLPPEGKVDTIYGVGHRGKSLDVGVLDDRDYLLLNLSIKTFNFKDGRTKNYRHNYTRRFYELLGEDLDLRRSYPFATLVALILLPLDSTTDTDPSSFAHAVRQFSKIQRKDREEHELGFEHVFVAIHSPAGEISFFDTSKIPPRYGAPRPKDLQTLRQLIEEVSRTVHDRREQIETAPLPNYSPHEFGEPTE